MYDLTKVYTYKTNMKYIVNYNVSRVNYKFKYMNILLTILFH